MSINSIVGMSCNMLSGLLFLIAMILLIMNRNEIEKRDVVMFLFLASIAIGIHGLGHYVGNDFTSLMDETYKKDKKEDNEYII
jgi:hypothetical protein